MASLDNASPSFEARRPPLNVMRNVPSRCRGSSASQPKWVRPIQSRRCAPQAHRNYGKSPPRKSIVVMTSSRLRPSFLWAAVLLLQAPLVCNWAVQQRYWWLSRPISGVGRGTAYAKYFPLEVAARRGMAMHECTGEPTGCRLDARARRGEGFRPVCRMIRLWRRQRQANGAAGAP
jgi:hypothetical protein